MATNESVHHFVLDGPLASASVADGDGLCGHPIVSHVGVAAVVVDESDVVGVGWVAGDARHPFSAGVLVVVVYSELDCLDVAGGICGAGAELVGDEIVAPETRRRADSVPVEAEKSVVVVVVVVVQTFTSENVSSVMFVESPHLGLLVSNFLISLRPLLRVHQECLR